MPEQTKNGGFSALRLPAPLQTKLEQLKFSVPTPIQERAIPLALEGADVLGIAQTGTGKTLAFGLPMAALLQPGQGGLVLAPTRELAMQIEETFHKLNVKTALLIGGAPMGNQVRQLRSNPRVVIATPGRLIDHMDSRTVNLGLISIVVLDEADRMLDMGFAPNIRKIMDATPAKRQTMLFSATMPKEIEELANRYLTNPVRVEVAPPGSTIDAIQQELVIVPHENKGALLSDLLAEHGGSVLVFARTRHGARKVAKAVRGFGHSAAELHSDRTLAQRRSALDGFKRGTYRVLVATDIAARGIDVKDITLVVNYDLPDNPEDYVHRIGRTGRAGASGIAITIATPEQHRDVKDIEKLLKLQLPLSKRSAARPQPVVRPAAPARPSHRPFRGNNNNHNGRRFATR